MTLAKEGVNVAICARRMEPLEKTAEEIRNAYGVTVVAITADLPKDADAKTFLEKAAKELGRIDMMINNAGFGAGRRDRARSPRPTGRRRCSSNSWARCAAFATRFRSWSSRAAAVS